MAQNYIVLVWLPFFQTANIMKITTLFFLCTFIFWCGRLSATVEFACQTSYNQTSKQQFFSQSEKFKEAFPLTKRDQRLLDLSQLLETAKQIKNDELEKYLKLLTEQKFSLQNQFLDGQKVQESIKMAINETEKLIDKTEKTIYRVKILEQDFMIQVEEIFKETTEQIYQAQAKLIYRMTPPFKNNTKVQNCIFPATNELSYENYLVSVLDSQVSAEYNFVFLDGYTSQYQASKKLFLVQIEPSGVPIKKIVIWYTSYGCLVGFQLFAKDDTKLFETGWQEFKKYNSQETILQDDERIIGFRGTKYYSSYTIYKDYYYDFQFVIGRLE